MIEEALEVATDPDYRFELAIQLSKLDIAQVTNSGQFDQDISIFQDINCPFFKLPTMFMWKSSFPVTHFFLLFLLTGNC